MVLDALSPQRRRLVVVAVSVGVLLIMISVMAVIRARSSAGEAVSQSDPGPVLVVPGYGGNVSSLEPLVTALRSTGRTAVIVAPPGGGTGDLQAQAEHVGEVAERAIDDSGASSVDIVGYSAGGVVARLWVRDEGGDRLARRVLTLGSPHHGTAQAALGAELAGDCPPACQQLVPESDLLRRLNADDETPDGPLWVTVRTTSDQVVTPVDSAALEGAVNIRVQDVCQTSTAAHGDLPSDPVVLAALGSVLGVEPPHSPTDVPC
jgi:triacylglycerol lipase